MLSISTKQVDRRSLSTRRYEQAIASHKISAEQFSAIAEVFNRRHISIEFFWKYVCGEKIDREHISPHAISEAISEVLDVEQFNNLIATDITWVN